MKKHSIFNRAVLLGLCSALTSLGAWGQNINPWLAEGLNNQIQQNQQNAKAAEEAHKARNRQRQLQQEIAELRRTPFYMAIAYDFTNKLVLRGGYYSEKRAIEEALDQCKSSNCQIVTTFANTCAMVARPEAGSQTANNWFVAFDNDPQQAIVKSVRACEAKHGNDKCYFWGGLTNIAQNKRESNRLPFFIACKINIKTSTKQRCRLPLPLQRHLAKARRRG